MKLKFAAVAIVAGTLASGAVSAQVGMPPGPGGPPGPPPMGPPAGGPPPGPAAAPPAPTTGLGSAITGLSAAQLSAFSAGRNDFFAPETPASGLGPIFNEGSCVNCHQSPAAGGSSGAPRSFVIRFGSGSGASFDPLISLGGSLLQSRSIAPNVVETIPASATVRATRITTPVFGAGLIEAIPDATIRALATQTKPDGVKGRAATILDVASNQSRVGRFGWKAQQASLLAFSADAYSNEMGITNRLFPAENAPNGNLALLAQINTQVRITGLQAPADATGLSKVDRVANFMRFLAPPPLQTLSASAATGKTVFQQIGCAVCHTPTLKTASTAPAPFTNVDVNLYSDLLLHDMGNLNDGIAQANAGTNEMKTAPLWGLSARPLWLHDGRARTIDAAILGHAGEAAISRGRYQQLNQTQRRQLMDFLNAL